MPKYNKAHTHSYLLQRHILIMVGTDYINA